MQAAVTLPPMTVAIASYQRREPLMRLLRELDRQIAADAELARDLDIVVVLDGSSDGSREAVEGNSWAAPVRVHWQPNHGRATARNVGLEAAAGHLVWFLDDDLLPSDGLVARHRNAHASGSPAEVVVGPCRIPPDIAAPAPLVRWWDSFYADLAERGVIDRFDRFTTANASAPADLLLAVGGFDTTFVEYGLEDYELAVRLLRTGATVRFDPEAVAWHPDIPPTSVLIARQYGIGLNAARLALLHPETVDSVFPVGGVSRPRRILRKARLRKSRSLMLVSRASYLVFRFTSALGGIVPPKGEMLSRAAAHAAGVAEGDPSGELLDRVLGYGMYAPSE
jgi:glycosyltransferase involved in cell wall biosynthesis